MDYVGGSSPECNPGPGDLFDEIAPVALAD
jgi:hypothetical protein